MTFMQLELRVLIAMRPLKIYIKNPENGRTVESLIKASLFFSYEFLPVRNKTALPWSL